jgi:hypothetical protein
VRLSAADSSETVSSGRLRRGSFMLCAVVQPGLEPPVVSGQAPAAGTYRNLLHVLDNLRADLAQPRARATGATTND